jgi:hypothetical protein
VDTAGAAYVTGFTGSINFPTTSGAFQPADATGSDVFVTKLNAPGTALAYSTYLGGSGIDYGKGIAVDASGAAYVTGYTTSSDFPVVAGSYKTTKTASTDVFITKLSPAGDALVYSTFLAVTGSQYGLSIAVDTAGDAHVTGYTSSTSFPTLNAVQTALAGDRDAFVTKLNAGGTRSGHYDADPQRHHGRHNATYNRCRRPCHL